MGIKPLSLNLSKMKKISGDASHSVFEHPAGHTITVAHAPLSALQRKQIEKMPVHNYAEGSDEQPVSSDDGADRSPASVTPEQMAQSGYADDVVPSVPHKDQPFVPGPNLNAPTQERTPAASPEFGQSEPQTSPPSKSGLPGISPMGVFGTGLAGIEAQRKAESGLGQAESKAIQDYQTQAQQHEFDWQKEQAEKLNDIGMATQDIQDQHINPNQYVENMSVPGKIASAIGMILGGAGAGAGRPNPGVEFLNNQINRDIASQQANLNTKKTLLGAFQQKYQNSVAAENMYRATRLANLGQDIQKAAANNADPMAQARALQAKAALESQIIPLVNNANLIQLGSKFNGSGPQQTQGGSEQEYLTYMNAAQRLNPELYKDAQSKYVPGIGVATHPVAQADAERLGNMNALAPLVDKAIADQENFGMTGAWTPKNRADANSDMNAIQVSLNKLTGLNRLNDREYQNYGQQIGKIGGVNLGGTLETIKNLKNQLETDRNTAHSNMGLVPFRGGQNPTGLNPQQQNNLNIYMKNNPGIGQQSAIQRLKQAGYL